MSPYSSEAKDAVSHSIASIETDGALLHRFVRDRRDDAARDELVARYLPLAHRLAHRYGRRREIAEDLEQVAAVGLIKALHRFDPGRGGTFRSFAIPTILGELRRYFRDSSWALRPSRTIQELAGRVTSAREQLTADLQRPPTTGEIAHFLGCGTEEVLEAVAALECQVLSLDGRPVAPDEPTLAERVGRTDDRFELVDDVLSVEPALAELSPRDRAIVLLRFQHDLSQSEIAERIGVSQMHVSRILRRSLERLHSITNAEAVRGAPVAA